MDQKPCSKCGAMKAIGEFKLQKRKTGFFPTSWCRECLNEKSRNFMREHLADPDVRAAKQDRDKRRYHEVLKHDPTFIESERKRGAAYRASPEAKVRSTEASRRWAAANPEKAREVQAAYRARNPEKMREATRRSRAKHREEYLARHVEIQNARKQRLASQGDGFTIHHARLARAWWDERCAYCGSVVLEASSARTGFDHVEATIAGGKHEPSNIVLCCKRCNDMKGSRPLVAEFVAKLDVQIAAFVASLPPESFYASRGRPPRHVVRAIAEAEAAMRGRGVPLGEPPRTQPR